MKRYDIAIVGGGLVGITAALALAKLGYKIGLVESIEPPSVASPSFDQRAIALSASSQCIYQSLGLWSLLSRFATPIEHIHVSDRGHFGLTRLHASDYQLAALGQVISLEETAPVLWALVKGQPNITAFCPASVTKISEQEKAVTLTLQQKERNLSIDAALLLAADGTFSRVAALLNWPYQRVSYGQSALVANISCAQSAQGWAYERFTRDGPIALLPLSRSRHSLVWCQSPEQTEKCLQLSEVDFCRALQLSFGYRLGKITKAGKRTSYPLSLHQPMQSFAERIVLLGNAAHTLHPIAGQGFNLALRDIAMLVEQLPKDRNLGNIGDMNLLKNYQLQRQADWKLTMKATDSLVKIFRPVDTPTVLLRNAAMAVCDNIPWVKRQLARAAMGYAGRSSQLARGLELPAMSSLKQGDGIRAAFEHSQSPVQCSHQESSPERQQEPQRDITR